MKFLKDILTFFRLPEVSIDLMKRETVKNHPFYAELVDKYYIEANSFHPRYKLFKMLRHGVALCVLPSSFDEYMEVIEASGRRNIKKAIRLGYVFSRIKFNDFLVDIAEIRRSTGYRQGKMPEDMIKGPVMPVHNPDSATHFHDYPYFGVKKGEKLVAYAGLFIAGEAAMIEHMLGHAEYQADGIVPLLISGMAERIFSDYPQVRYYCYGMWFGASITMRRFKRKFGFYPYRVSWLLG